MRRSTHILFITGLLAVVTTPLWAQNRGPYAGPPVCAETLPAIWA
jgi:hypothetical protein